MIFRERHKLPIHQMISGGGYSVPLVSLIDALAEHPSHVIYIEHDDVLVGVISTGDIDRRIAVGEFDIPINKNCARVSQGDVMAALKVFKDRKNINNIPIVDEKGRLIGEYCRCDDVRFYKRLREEFDRCETGDIMPGSKLLLVCPADDDEALMEAFRMMGDYLRSIGADVEEVDRREITTVINRYPSGLFLFADTNDMMGMPSNAKYCARINETQVFEVFVWTYRLYLQGRNWSLSPQRHVASVLRFFQDLGVRILCLFAHRNIGKFDMELRRRIQLRKNSKDITAVEDLNTLKGFFGELWSPEHFRDIKTQLASAGIELHNGVLRMKDITSKTANVKDGIRLTKDVPEDAKRSVLFFGPCAVFGHFVDDQHTIASCLQECLNGNDRPVRVLNLGVTAISAHDMLSVIFDTNIEQNDVVVLFFREYEPTPDIPSMNLYDILDASDAKAEWVTDSPLHCNHKVNKIYADAIYEKIRPWLDEPASDDPKPIGDIRGKLMEMTFDAFYAPHLARVDLASFSSVGAIVMNCNPFTNGHRYLIEEARKRVEHLIIFVVSEDLSLFTFETRYAMVREGTKDLGGITIMPSGDLILSARTFPGYFAKIADEDLVKNTEYDITTFAEKIASRAHITHRFVGDEPEDEVTRAYNDAMKKILPKHGIELVEIPRKEIDGRAISASSVRKCLEERDTETLRRLVPESTVRLIEHAE